ncbi:MULTISPECIES: hypothetical protein [unclassified Mesorhizobium]|uniref:hypothetical protein n=1 Tax=unclassified Mesorhizobium TaxID=325217 RepID=UPI00112C7689|nr:MULTISPECIES: hypothetical protein [unclassified Mesorhizobium]TPJ86924.1 hypothetical protein FJ489_30690 [Mesorhizobium sp. B2-5-12]TPK19147.1 hypothetical protein FJ562_31095 [Mesorhizobium sp. B2-5-6]
MIGGRCRILLGEYDGNVVGKRTYIGEADRYAVRYLDDSGPQERWFQAHEISFDGREAEGNVVDFRRTA